MGILCCFPTENQIHNNQIHNSQVCDNNFICNYTM